MASSNCNTMLLLLGSCFILAFPFAECSFDHAECARGRVITDDYQARRECLNLTKEVMEPPPPIVLATADENKQFLCKNELPLEAFSCTLFGFDLIWYFNGEKVTAFLPDDPIGDKVSISYPSSSPVYNLTAVLTQVTQITALSRFNLPFCVSILIVQPFNESQTEILPYTVTCQTHCTGDNGSQVCQTKRYEIADKPALPSGASGSIKDVDSTESIVTVNWSPPENHNHTAIDYYELTLIGTHSNTTTIVHVGEDSQQFLSHKLVVSEGNYTAASITAVDMCGQRSEPSHFILTSIVTDTSTCTSSFLTSTMSMILIIVLASIIIIIAVILLVISLVCLAVWCRRMRE